MSELQKAIERTTASLLKDRQRFDAIVVGSGAAGGLAARLLTGAGLEVLVLDAGYRKRFVHAPFRRTSAAMVEGLADPRWYEILPPQLINFGRRGFKLVGRVRQPVQSRNFAWEMAPETFVDDRDIPYEATPDAPFHWYRARAIGGRMMVPGHGRQYYRLPAEEFTAKPGRTPGWPVSAEEMDEWYAFVERELELTGGEHEAPDQAPSLLATQLPMNASEAQLREQIIAKWPTITPVLGQHAPPMDDMVRAARTGRMWCRTGAAVQKVLFDDKGRLSGVEWHDRNHGEKAAAHAPVIFMCASAMESTRILMNSRSSHHPKGVGGESGALGKYLMDHVLVSGEGMGGELPDAPVKAQPGRSVYVPRFDRRAEAAADAPVFGVQIYRASVGRKKSHFNAVTFGEMAPREENCVELHEQARDRFGMPILKVRCAFDAGELDAARSQAEGIRELAELSGAKLFRLDETPAIPGTAMHECGTARMGERSDGSVLDAHNQAWDAPGLYVTDAASFASQGAQNPTLTIQALTARACAHALSGKAQPRPADLKLRDDAGGAPRAATGESS